MEEVKNQIRKIIEIEYKDALNKGLLDPAKVVNKIWKLLIEKDAVNIMAPEPAFGCYENLDEQ